MGKNNNPEYEKLKEELFDSDQLKYNSAIADWFKNKGQITVVEISNRYGTSCSILTKLIKIEIEKITQVLIPDNFNEIKLTSPINHIDSLVNSQKYAVAHTTELFEYLANNSRETIIKNYHVQRKRDLQDVS